MYSHFDNFLTEIDTTNQRSTAADISPAANFNGFSFNFEPNVAIQEEDESMTPSNNNISFNSADLWGFSFDSSMKPTSQIPSDSLFAIQSQALPTDPFQSCRSFDNNISTLPPNTLNQIHQFMSHNITATGAGYVPDDYYSTASQNDSPSTINQSPDYILHFPEFEDVKMINDEQHAPLSSMMKEIVVKQEKPQHEEKPSSSGSSTPSTASSSTSSPINAAPEPQSQEKKHKETLLEKIIKIEKTSEKENPPKKRRGRKKKTPDYEYMQDDDEEKETVKKSPSSSSGDEDEEVDEKYEMTDVGLKLLKRGKKRSRTEEQIDRDRLEQLLKKKNSQLTKKEKEEKRVLRNRFTAKISREKRKQENMVLSQQNSKLSDENRKMKDEIKMLKDENFDLKKQLEQQKTQFLTKTSLLSGSDSEINTLNLFSVSILVVLSLGLFFYPLIFASKVSGSKIDSSFELLLTRIRAHYEAQNSIYISNYNENSKINEPPFKKSKVKGRTLKSLIVKNNNNLLHQMKTTTSNTIEEIKKIKKNRWDRFYNSNNNNNEFENKTEKESFPVVLETVSRSQVSLFFPKITPANFKFLNNISETLSNSRISVQNNKFSQY